jgi:hypothetical protein
MTIVDPITAPLPPYSPPYAPITNITPFTYRDGETYLRVLERLRHYITDVVVPYVDTEFALLGNEFTTQVNTMIDTVNEALASQSATVDADIAALTQFVNDTMAAVVADSITLQDPVMAGIVNDAASATRVALNALYVNETDFASGIQTTLDNTVGTVHVNAPDGSITYAALQTALTAAATAGKKVVAYGTITTDQTVTIKCDADLGALNINYTGNGIAVQVGANSGVTTWNKTVTVPRVIHTAKTLTGWSQVAGTIGVRLINLVSCKVYVPYIRNFETTLDNRGEGTGHVYNTITLGTINNGKFGITFLSDATGWTNQNTFLGGSVQMDSAEGNRVVGTRAVFFNTSANLPNTNSFVGTSFEGNGWEYAFETYGLYNVMYNCRFESSLGPRVWFRASATRNVIREGYGNIVATYEAGAIRNVIDQAGLVKRMGVSGTTPVYQLQNDTSNSNAVLVVGDSGSIESGADMTTAYDWSMSAQVLSGKRSADAFARLALSANGGTLLFGNGTAAPSAGVGGTGTTLLVQSAGTTAVAPTVDATTDLGSSVARFKDVYAGAFMLKTTTTAARPAPRLGAMMFDTDLVKPIFGTATVWKDATGATV